jgi:iron complex transport system substrate-binding protein
VKVVSLKPERLSDIWEDIRRVGAATGVETAAEDLIRGLKRRLWKLEQQTRRVARPRVAYIEWLDPLMAGGNWIAELVEIAGGEYGLAAAGAHSPKLTWEALVEYQPEVIVITPCGFKIPQTQADLSIVTSHPQWQTLPAVKAKRVYVANGNAYFNRPGPRIIESAEILAEILHPEECADLAPRGSYVHL